MPNHNPTSCHLCERVPADSYRRHWKHEAKMGYWHVIADGPDLMARLPCQAHYITVLAYQPSNDGSHARYRGPLYAEWDSHDPAAVLHELRTCLQVLQVAYDLPLEALRLWHSGGRGYHLTLPAVVFGAVDGHRELPRIYRAMIERLFAASIAPSLDRSIYNAGRGRMWRLPGHRRPDNRRYKVPLAVREVLHRPRPDIEALTIRPRHGVYCLPDSELSLCSGLLRLYEEARADVERQGMPSRAPHAPSGEPGLLYRLFEARGWVSRELAPGRWAVICPWTDAHTTGTVGDSSCVLFAPGDGESTGWWYCSHAHCAARDLRDVLALFGRRERDRAREAAGLPGPSDGAPARPLLGARYLRQEVPT